MWWFVCSLVWLLVLFFAVWLYCFWWSPTAAAHERPTSGSTSNVATWLTDGDSLEADDAFWSHPAFEPSLSHLKTGWQCHWPPCPRSLLCRESEGHACLTGSCRVLRARPVHRELSWSLDFQPLRREGACRFGSVASAYGNWDQWGYF